MKISSFKEIDPANLRVLFKRGSIRAIGRRYKSIVAVS